MKLLLHTCCAPCSVYCVEELQKENIDITSYFYNPNIHPYKEYESRLNCLIEYNKNNNIPLIVDYYYGLKEFCKNTINILDKRCGYCYLLRLEKTAIYAKENGYDAFSTTLLISPYQNHELLKKTGKMLEKKHNIKFFYKDFRPGFRYGQNKARELGLYMQKYCGCIFSEESRYNNPNPPKPELPDDFEFLPVKRSIVIKKEKDNKDKYLDLLLEADPEKEVIEKYLQDGELFVLTFNDDVACVAVVTKIDDNTCELKNISTAEKYRGQGYGKKMIKYIFDNYKQKYDKMVVGTTENNIPFYVKQGFDKYEKTIKNYFVDNYDEEIIDGDLHCIDMYYYSKDLKKG